jgi:spore germination protein YaaH
MKISLSSKVFHIAIAFLLVFAALAAALPRPAQAATSAVCEDTHTVKSGDTIYNLAKKYETTVNKLARANDLEKPYTLTVGQSLCIPAPRQPSSNYTWSAVLSNGQVTVTGEKFKKNHPFHIKVREDLDSPWVKLGKVTADKSGELEKKFTLNKSLSNASVLYVCLKDGVTDYLDCKRVLEQ